MKNEKIEKLKIKFFRKAALILLWSSLFFLVFKGVLSLINPVYIDEESIIEEYENANSKKQITDNTVSFTENFVREYMTFYGDSDEYSKRLKPFVDNDLDLINTKLFEVSYVNSINYKEAGSNLILVDCMVSGTKYSDKDKNESDSKKIISEEKYYIRSAVKIKNEKFVIADYPIFISSPSSVETDGEDLKGKILDDESEEKQIKEVISSFLDAYYKGENTEINYFVENPESSEKKKDFKFSDINDFNVNWNEKNLYYVESSYYVDNGDSKFLQSMEFEIKFENEKYVITKYDVKL